MSWRRVRRACSVPPFSMCSESALLRDIGVVLLLRDIGAAEGHRCVAGVLSDASEGP